MASEYLLKSPRTLRTHGEHISTVRRTVGTIWNHWLPASGMQAADALSFERYGEQFDPATINRIALNGGHAALCPPHGLTRLRASAKLLIA
jgi:hypothetical protein